MNRKFLIGLLILVLLLVAWFVVRVVWFSGPVIPNTPPTAEELERIRAVEETSSQIAPDAKAGAGVFAPGTLPAPTPQPESTTTESADTGAE